VYISDDRSLTELCNSLSESPVIALDTEFMRERTYHARLCLIQIAVSDRSAVIDPFQISGFQPLVELLTDDKIVKVIHAGQQDLEIIFQEMGVVVSPVFDTQIAAALAGFQSQTSYQNLVAELIGVRIDKSDTYTDWSRRPLFEAQIEYAHNDVRYLPAIYDRLYQRLVSTARLEWLTPEFEAFRDPANLVVDPDSIFRKVKRASSLGRRQLGLLQKIAAWRETEARNRNIPRKWVLPDETLVEIARRCPKVSSELLAIRGVSDRLPKSSYAELLSAVAEGSAIPEADLPTHTKRRRKPADSDGVVDLMAALVRVRAKEHDVAATVLASRDDIEDLASGDRERSPLLAGWRRTLVGDDLLQLLDGKLSIAVADSSLCVTRVYEDVIGDIEDGTHLA